MDRFNALDKDEVLRFFNSRPIPPDAYVILFLGDSLTCHGPKENVWNHYNGMAATRYELDFVHRFAVGVQELLKPRPVEVQIYSTGSIVTILAHLKGNCYEPDLVVFQGGENDAFDEVFRECYRDLIRFFEGGNRAERVDAIVLGDWYSRDKAEFDRREAEQAGYPFVDLFSLQTVPGNTGNGGPFNHIGVASHPTDAGMEAISDALLRAFRDHVLGGLGSESTRIH